MWTTLHSTCDVKMLCGVVPCVVRYVAHIRVWKKSRKIAHFDGEAISKGASYTQIDRHFVGKLCRPKDSDLFLLNHTKWRRCKSCQVRRTFFSGSHAVKKSNLKGKYGQNFGGRIAKKSFGHAGRRCRSGVWTYRKKIWMKSGGENARQKSLFHSSTE